MSLENLAGVTVEVGFGVNAVGGDFFVLDDPVKGLLDDGAGTYNTVYGLAPDTVFIDVTSHVAAVSTSRGRERELDEYSAGRATVMFNDNDRTFDPAHTASPYYGQITPQRRIRVKHLGVFLFDGKVEDWSVDYEPGDTLSRVTAECTDGFAVLANQELPAITAAHSGDLSGERITRVLDLDEVSFPATRSIDDGNSTLGATTFGSNVLSYLQSCATAEAGYLFVAKDGTLTFRNRLATLNVPAGVTFSDDRSAGIPYMRITQRSSSDLLFTKVTGESETIGNALSADDAAAQDEYLIRTLPLGALFNSTDAEVQSLLDANLERYSSPELRFHRATINVAALSSEEAAQVVALELTDAVQVERSPLHGIGDMIVILSLIDGIEHRITPGSWMCDLSFANADTRVFLELDHATFGQLDLGRLAF